MRRLPPIPSPPADSAYLLHLVDLARPFGITRVGVAPADVMEATRRELHRRKAAGLHDGMQFTYRNPDRSTDPGRVVRGARSIFVGALPYLGDEPPRPGGVAARVARYAWTDRYAPLRAGLRAVADQLHADGYRAVVLADDNSIVDREVAYRAGLGWYGKNANLLIGGGGSWFVLGCVVTDADLPVSAGPVADGCGSCRRCIDACPTGAIVADGVIDASRCLAWVLQKPGIIPTDLRQAVGDRLYGCDDCQTSCPPSMRLGPRQANLTAADDAWVDAVDLLDATDEEILARWGRWYLADRDPVWLRRNALVIVGNSGTPVAPVVVETIRRYLAHARPELRAHAVWAARCLGLHSMIPTTDPHPDVQAELVPL